MLKTWKAPFFSWSIGAGFAAHISAKKSNPVYMIQAKKNFILYLKLD